MTRKIKIVEAALGRLKQDRLPRGELFIDRAFLNQYFSREKRDYVGQLKAACEGLDLDLMGIEIHADASKNLKARNEYGKLKEFFTVALLDGPFNRMIKKKGFEEAMMELKSNPSSYTDVSSKLMRELETLMPLFIEKSFNGVAVLDDIAGNQGLMMSQTDFKDLLYPFYQNAVNLIKENGLYSFFHSDGNILDILKFILDVGFDCFHCIDAQAGMDLDVLSKRHTQRIAFMGHIDLLAWDERRIELEVDKAEKNFPDGGVILGSSCGLSSLIPVSRIKVFYPAWEPTLEV